LSEPHFTVVSAATPPRQPQACQRASRDALKQVVEALSSASEELARRLGSEFVGMVLFGSWARREAREDSDVDVLVVLRSLSGMRARSEIYRVIARRVKRPVTLIDMRLSELLREDLELTPLLINIVADAVVICDRHGAIRSFIERGRRLIRKARLVRYRTPDGKYGWRREDMRPIEPVEL